MAVQTRILQQHNVVEILQAIQELATNPEALASVKDEIKQANALSEVEKQKAIDARNYIEQHNSLVEELDDAHKKLRIAKEEFEDKVKEQDTHQRDDLSKQLARNEALNKKEIILNTREKQIDANEYTIKQLTKAFEAAKEDYRLKSEAREAQLKHWEEQLQVKHSKVQEKEQLLNEKHEKLKSILGQ